MAYTINGRTLDDLIFQSLMLEGHVAPILPTWEAVPLAQGASVLTPTARLSARRLRITVDLRPATLVDRVATQDALAGRLAGGLRIATTDAPDRVWYATLAQVAVEMPAGPVVNPLCVVDLDFTLHDARRGDLETQLRALSATPVACPTGTGVSAPTITLFGAATAVVDPVVTLARFDGEPVAALTLTGSLGTNTWLEIDCATEWIWLYTAGVKTNALPYLDSGVFPLLAREDAAGVDGPYPLLSLSSASGTPTGLVAWRRTWH